MGLRHENFILIVSPSSLIIYNSYREVVKK
jgi:hypothetical protein